MFAQAAGVGKLTVLSALGQPLRAEIELMATRDELSSLTAKLANQEQFRQQGMEFNAAIASLNFSIEKRPNGQPYVRLTSDRPINEPFLDILVELSWASGRLTREYTFLLDPVEMPRPGMGGPGVSPVTSTHAPAVVDTSPARMGKSGKASTRMAPAAKPASEAKTQGAATREVKSGDTLGKIAAETAPDGVSIDQMLVALYNNNRDAFIDDNLNRVRAGKILSIPDRDTATAISDAEAHKTVVLHARNFNAYRRQLADAAAAGGASEAPAAQADSGKITPKVEDKAPAPAAGKDRLEVSKSDGGKAGSPAAGKANEAELIAKEKALKEAEARIAMLEKNVADLKKLNEIKSQTLAEAEKKAGGEKPAEPAKPEAPKAAAPAAPVAETTPATPAAQAPAATPATSPTQAPEAEAAKPAEAPPVAAEKPAEPAAPPPPKKKKVVLPPPEPEPTFMEEYGPFVYLGGALVALLGGFFGFREWKRRKMLDATTSQFDEPSSTSSVFGTTGGQSVDTNNVSLASGFSQTSLTGNEGTAGVDPVAEAEVYMAYGRDAQAEEILLEAIKTDPGRQAVHLKLLELYAGRKSIKPFEEVARDLKQQTGGTGPNWDRAAALGKAIDPGNPLYSSEQSPSDTQNMEAFGTSTVIMPPGQLAKMAAMDPAKADTVVLDTGAAPAPEAAPAEAGPGAEQGAGAEEMPSFDLDLGDEPASVTASETEPVTLDFDLDLGADVPAGTSTPASGAAQADAGQTLDLEMPSISPAEAPAAPALDIEFDLGLPAAGGQTPPPPPAPTTGESPSTPPAGNSVDFDFNLETPAAGEGAPEPGSISPAVDFSDINLELNPPASGSASEAPAAPSSIVEEPEASAFAEEAPAADEAENPEVATKLELAQAYEEMGDKEGMRELLQEVLSEGNSAQQEVARNKLAEHGF